MSFDKEFWNKMLPKKHFFTTTDLLNMGLFGSKRGWYETIKKYSIPIFYISSYRMLVTREDLIEFLIKRSETKD